MEKYLGNLTQLERNRLEKVHQMKELGIEPYPAIVERTHTNHQAVKDFLSSEPSESSKKLHVTVVGRIRSMRMMGKIAFAHIEDGTGPIQLFFRLDEIGEEQLDYLKRFYDLGDYIQASGEIFRTRTEEISVNVSKFQMLAKAITPLPAAKDEEVNGEIIRHASLTDPETRFRQRYADLAVNPDIRRVFETRSKIIRCLREFLEANNFLEVETPILQPIYGGAAARPFVTNHNQLKQELYLRISFELYLKRLLVGGIERVFEIGRDFRNEGVDRTHNPEFTQLEFYMAYADYTKVMELTEEMLAFTATKVLGSTKLIYQGREFDLGKPWRRIELKEGLIEIAKIDIDQYPDSVSLFNALKEKGLNPDPNAPRGKLIDMLIGEYLEPNFIEPTFLYNYPRDISPLAKNHPSSPSVVERFEGFVAGMELCNAFSELNDPIEQEVRFFEMGRAFNSEEDDDFHPMDEDYLRAMRYGMPPNGGFGMGIDRLAMLFTDKANIREVILFPHLRNKEEI